MKNNKVYIIVLNWNGTQDTIACLSSLKQLAYDNFQIVLVDNGSKQDSFFSLLSWIKENFKNVLRYNRTEALAGGRLRDEITILNGNPDDNLIVIENGDNLGFAAGNNVALKYVLKMKGDQSLTLLLNNDTEVEKDFLCKLTGFFQENENYVAVTPQIRLFKSKTKIWNCGGKLTWFGNRRYYYAGKNISEVPQKGSKNIEFVTGCALLFKPTVTGLLTERFFFGEEDFEFSLRLKKRKQKMACVLDAVIYHKVGGAVVKNFSKSNNRLFLHYVSRLIDHKAYYSQPFRLFIKWLNLSYGLYLTVFKYSFGFVKSIRFWKRANSFVRNNNSVKRDAFFKIMGGKYLF